MVAFQWGFVVSVAITFSFFLLFNTVCKVEPLFSPIPFCHVSDIFFSHWTEKKWIQNTLSLRLFSAELLTFSQLESVNLVRQKSLNPWSDGNLEVNPAQRAVTPRPLGCSSFPKIPLDSGPLAHLFWLLSPSPLISLTVYFWWSHKGEWVLRMRTPVRIPWESSFSNCVSS